MFTDPAYRGQGVNQKIIAGLKEWAILKQVTEFRLEVYPGNTAAINAYKKVGFSNYLLEMRLSVR
ncbi:MAG: GNAT family N-acetyltransferase [Chitinophagaceae bacterium]